MTTTKECIAPEDVMALLDGELSAADARVVSAHLEQCPECALVAEQLRDTSEWLLRWDVESVPEAVEKAVATRVDSGRKHTGRRRFFFWKPLAVGAGVVTLGAVMVVAISYGRYRSISKHALMHGTEISLAPYEQLGQAKQADRFSGGGLEQLGTGPMAEPKFQDKMRKGQPPSAMEKRSGSPPAVAGMAGMSAVGGIVVGSVNASLSSDAPAPMITRMMFLTMIVKNADAARVSLDAILARHHGYSASLSASSPVDGSHGVRASLRVPAAELASTVAEIKALGRVLDETQSGEEVSQQHADLVARLKTARETEERFENVLRQRTGRVSDVLEVEQNIARVRGEIEGMEAEQKALEHRVGFATVEVQLREEYKAQLGSQPVTFSTQMHNAVVEGYRNVTDMLEGIVLFVVEYGPVLLISLMLLALPALLLWRWYKRARVL